MEVVGDYEYNTKDLIGHGAFAVVFKGRCKAKHDLTVAVKSITKKNLAKSQNLLAKEIKILKELAELHHENVVALLECKETTHHVYLVMEYCNGGDLADYLNAKGTLSEDTIYLFLRQIAAAMKALKAKGIVHRDLKPQNILLCHDGRPNPPPSKIHLKIADFGFARFLHDGIMAATLCGSPMYMAPEVIMSLQYDAKADLWSIGTIIYQCLTGKAPFQAQSPQALKQFYEMKTTLSPKIPACTSPNLADLLLKLLKRNAKDRMEFSDFFRHVFLKPVNKPSSPVPVPSRRSLSSDVSSPISSPPYGSPISANLPPSPQGWWGEVSRDGPTPETGIQMAASTSLDKQPPGGRGRTLSSSTEEQDFVMVPADLADLSGNPHPGGSLKMHSVSPGSSPSRNQVPVTPSPRMSSNVTVDPHFGSARFHAPRVSGLGSPRPSHLPVSGSPAPTPSACVSRSCQRSEPMPVPSQKEAYEQIQRSLEEEPPGLVGVQRERTSSVTPAARTSSSPHLPESSVFSSEMTGPKKDSSSSQSSENWTVSTICSLSPPPIVQFTIGTPPGGGRRRAYSGGTPPSLSSRHISASLRQCFTSSPSLTLSTSPLRRSNVAMANLTTFATGNPLSPILGSPTKELSRTEESYSELGNQKEYSKTKVMDMYRYSGSSTQRTTFSTRAVTLPEICSQKFWPGSGCGVPELMDHQKSSLNRSGSSSRLSERGFHRAISLPGTQYISHTPPETTMMPYGHPSHHCCLNEMMTPYGSPDRLRRNSTGCCKFHDSSFNTQACLLYSNSPPHLEEAVMFIAPELPEETILEKEHNETLAKLNFVLALVECVLDLAKSKGNPLASLTDSFMNRESQLGQIPVVTEGWRRAEQLVLFTRALQLLSSSLQLSRQEVDAGRLSPSTSMRFVLQSLKERFHYCFNMCKSLNSPGTLHALGVDLSTYSITADQLIYNYAIEMCQSAALEELFGNPEECFRRYQTAQILFHSLAQQITNDEDKKLLNKYKEAVERRLYVLQSQGYVQAYDTTYC